MTDYDDVDQRAETESDFENLVAEEQPRSGDVSTVLSVRLRGDELAAVEQAASAADLPVSTFVRRAAVATAQVLDVRAVSAQAEAVQVEARKLVALLRDNVA